MVATGIAKPWKEKTNEIVPQIIHVIHAASRIIPAKIEIHFRMVVKPGTEAYPKELSYCLFLQQSL